MTGDNKDEGMIKRLKAYQEDEVKVSGLLVRIIALVANRFNEEFKLEKTQNEADILIGSLNSDGLLRIGQD